MLVTNRHRTRGRDLVKIVAEAVLGGVGFVQIRELDLPDADLLELTKRIQSAVPRGTVVAVNANLRVARLRKTGLHLPAQALGLGSPDLAGRPYGRSVHDETEMRVAVEDGARYLTAEGIRLIERICRQVHPLPVYATGEIAVSRVPALIHAGAYGIAVGATILEANDPRRIAEALHLALEVSVRAAGAEGAQHP